MADEKKYARRVKRIIHDYLVDSIASTTHTSPSPPFFPIFFILAMTMTSNSRNFSKFREISREIAKLQDNFILLKYRQTNTLTYRAYAHLKK